MDQITCSSSLRDLQKLDVQNGCWILILNTTTYEKKGARGNKTYSCYLAQMLIYSFSPRCMKGPSDWII